MPALTALKVQKAKHVGERKGPLLLSDGDGLSLQIMPSGSKSWILRFMLKGKARTMGLGAYGENGGVSLAMARDAASAARALLRQGIDPIQQREATRIAEEDARAAISARGKSFEDASREFIAGQEAGWRNAKHRAQWTSTLATHAFPKIGPMPVGDVDADAVMTVLEPIWLTIPETASRLRGRIESVLDYAKARGWRSGDNPARWKESLKHRLPNVSRVRRTTHHPALPWQRVPNFVTALREKDSVSARALLFCVLTACRSGEARGATWREIDLENAVWTIPGERMKAGREHRVPLSAPAIDLLKAVYPLARGGESLIFPGARSGKPLSDMALTQLLRGMNEGENKWLAQDGRPIVAHGFRSTFRDWCEEATSTPHAVSEAALAHVVANKVEAAYRRTDLFDKRRVLMNTWAVHCISIT